MRLKLLILTVLLGVWFAVPVRADTPGDTALVLRIAAERRLPPMSEPARLALGATKAKLVAGDTTQANAELAKWLKAHKPSLSDALKVATWLVREGVLEQTPALAKAADRARFFAEQRAMLNGHLSDLRKLQKGGKPTVKLRLLKLSPYTKGADAAQLEANEASLSQAALGKRITQLEGALAKISDMTELTKLELQAESANQQQLLQTLSAISKSLHDTSKAIIRNIKS